MYVAPKKTFNSKICPRYALIPSNYLNSNDLNHRYINTITFFNLNYYEKKSTLKNQPSLHILLFKIK